MMVIVPPTRTSPGKRRGRSQPERRASVALLRRPPVDVAEHGVDGRPTLVQNVRDLRPRRPRRPLRRPVVPGVGHAELPGTMLLSVSAAGIPAVVEAPLGHGSSTSSVWRRPTSAGPRRLLGGYGGGWVPPEALLDLHVDERQVRQAGAHARHRDRRPARRRCVPAGRGGRGSSATWPARERGSAVRAARVCRRWLMSSSGARSGPAPPRPASARSSTCVISSRVVAPAGTLTASLGSSRGRARVRRRDRRPPAAGAVPPDPGRRLAPRPRSVRYRRGQARTTHDRIGTSSSSSIPSPARPRGMRRALPERHSTGPVGLSPCQAPVDPARPE